MSQGHNALLQPGLEPRLSDSFCIIFCIIIRLLYNFCTIIRLHFASSTIISTTKAWFIVVCVILIITYLQLGMHASFNEAELCIVDSAVTKYL